MTRAASASDSAPATCAAATSPMLWPDHRVRLHAPGPPQRGQRHLDGEQRGLHDVDPIRAATDRRRPRSSSSSDQSTCGASAARTARAPRANTGSVASSARPMPSHCEPCPGNTNTTRGRPVCVRPDTSPAGASPVVQARAAPPARARWRRRRPADARGACGGRWPCSTHRRGRAASGCLEQRHPALGERAECLRSSSR